MHCHTTKSDGSNTPSNLISLASRLSLPTVAITDHDTMAGIGEARKKGRELGIEVIEGIEVSTYDYEHEKKVHLLCYYPKKTDTLIKMCDKTLEARSAATLKMLEKVSKRYPINKQVLEQYSNGSMAFYKQNIVRALADMGYTLSVFGDLYRELFSPKNGWAYVGFKMIDTSEAFEVLKETGGAVILAHPGVYNNFDIIDKLAENGLDGIEVNHPRQSDEDKIKAAQAADRFSLIKTGGSDFHGLNSSKINPLGICQIDAAQLEKLKQKFSL